MNRARDDFIWRKMLSQQVALMAVIATICFTTSPTNALDCYTCSFGETDTDRTCLTDLAEHQITHCTKKYCTIIRQDKIATGRAVSFQRGCEDKPQYMNAEKTDASYHFYYRSCATDLCNDSDGRQSATNTDPNFGASTNAIIPGKSGGAPAAVGASAAAACLLIVSIVRKIL